jgi:hypothetical protein
MRSRTNSKSEKGKCNGSNSAVVLFFAAATVVFTASTGWTAQEWGEVNVQGGWVYSARNEDGVVEHVAATRATEDAVWFLLACRADGRLTVSFTHSERFPFPLKPVSSVKLQSNNVPTALFEAKSIETNQIFVAPLLMRHIMPLLMQDDELVVSIPDRDGVIHNYTFSMRPNDVALSAFRSHCFDS